MGRAIEAVYESGLLRPKVPVALVEGQTVTVVVRTPTFAVQLRCERDERLRRHFGAWRSGDPGPGDNDRIDADLALGYGSSGAPERQMLVAAPGSLLQ
ncbi:MAG: hypothetical protein AUJ96_09560 [Armatimonadetes bacterium CG2_30_66_41]|nr:antitoxin family protein [Armatimonadota bacterium]OIP06221.1 MAG: hypothetical protein AUJ96_09560 [Armatimonadetes bacterium CG2_30_66_41]NCO94698.1 antitoxin family protein [Armatimonadota bacterium]NCP34486.1 antitoxin family protein [Armatimonadota bacterium]NCQ29148.1 antitoxin family protein [Armatimonadota bacterium]